MLLLPYYCQVTQMTIGVLCHYFYTSQHVFSEICQYAFIIGLLEYGQRVIVLWGVEQIT